MKKILKYFMLCFTFVLGFLVTSIDVQAETYKGDFGEGGYIPTKVYVNKAQSNGYTKWQRAMYLTQASTGDVVYCMQPMVDIIDGYIYNVTNEDYSGAQNLSAEQYDRIRLLAYYGYGYGNHTSLDWASVTQTLIWRTTRPDLDIYYSWGAKTENRDDSIFADKIAELNNLVANHYKRPSFNTNKIKLTIGESKTIQDTNGVLSLYKIKTSNNVTSVISGNNLNITATSVGTGLITLEKNNQRFYREPLIFYAADSQNIFKPGDPKPVLAKLDIEVIGGYVNLNKLDNDTLESIPQGEATLGGAVYGIYTEDGEKVSTVTTDENGSAKSDYLPGLNKYYLLEEKAPEGYEKSDKKYYFEITQDNLTPTVVVKDKIIKMKYNLTKVMAQSSTGNMIPESNVKFAFIDKKGNVFQEVITDDNGNLSVELPYGKYTVKQLTVTPGYEKVKDFLIDVNKSETKNEVIANAEITAKLKVIKIDKETGEAIKRSGIKFKIKSVTTNEYVCQKITYPSAKNICEFETDNEGILITPYPLSSGKYKLEEVDQVVDGYMWNKESVEFEIGENANLITDNDYGVLFETKFENQPVKGTIIINKKGENFVTKDNSYYYNDISLSEIKFGLYSLDGDLILETKTDDNGVAKFENLKLGSYIVKELETLDNYILDTKEYKVDLKYKDQYTAIVSETINIKNKLSKGTLDFTKTDFSTSEPIPNTKISIYLYDDERETLIGEYLTDENGKVIISDLPSGQKYYILETAASDGYILNEEKMYFEITSNGEIIKSNMTNEKIKSKIIIHKVNEENNPLANVVIGIFDTNDKLVGEYTTNADGIVEVEIEYGKYYYQEIKTIDNYILNEEKVYFEVVQNNEIIESTLINKLEEIEVPDTIKNDYINILLIILTVAGTGMVIYGISKKKK